jgi:signal transduction histidine kinase
VTQLGESIREISSELQPRILKDTGLGSALRWFAQAVKNISCVFTPPSKDIVMDVLAANELFAICRELVAEVLAPAGVSGVEIGLEQDGEIVHLHLRVADGEAGRKLFSGQTLDGLAAQDRLSCVDGTLELDYPAEGGCVLTLSAPASGAAACAAS